MLCLIVCFHGGNACWYLAKPPQWLACVHHASMCIARKHVHGMQALHACHAHIAATQQHHAVDSHTWLVVVQHVSTGLRISVCGVCWHCCGVCLLGVLQHQHHQQAERLLSWQHPYCLVCVFVGWRLDKLQCNQKCIVGLAARAAPCYSRRSGGVLCRTALSHESHCEVSTDMCSTLRCHAG